MYEFFEGVFGYEIIPERKHDIANKIAYYQTTSLIFPIHVIMTKKSFLLLSSTLFILSISSPAYAYLDPGSGNILLQGLFAGVAGIAAVLKIYWQHCQQFFRKLFKKHTPSSPQSPPQKHE